MAKATFAAGCFWGPEHAFRKIEGVTDTRVGYTGGHTEDPSYEEVCSGKTGHAEAVQVEYDPDVVSYKELLDLFMSIHDPTQKDRQGPDVGSQYRSAVFCHDDDQRQLAEGTLQEHQEKRGKPIATQVDEAQPFWPAEEYHQRYYEKHKMGSFLSR